MILLALFGIGLLVRVVAGLMFAGPAYPDSFYYTHVAQQLAMGHGFVVDYLWNFDDAARALGAASTLPVPANGYWMPLAEIVQVPFVALLGPGAAGVAFWIVGALCAPLTYFIGRDAGLAKGAAAAAGVMVAVPAGLTPFMAQPDNFALTMLFGALALWMAARAWRGDRRAFVIGALVVALATLARLDGVLLGVPLLWIALRRGQTRIDARTVVLAGVVFAVILGPWLVRQVAVYGTPFPASSDRVLWLTQYQQLFSATQPPSFGQWLNQGPLAIVTSRVGGLLAALGTFALLPLVVVLVPFAIAGAWVSRRSVHFRPWFVYAALLFAINALLYPVLVLHGTFLHAAVALVPHTFLLVIVGVRAVVGWVARRRPTWNAPTATRVFTGAAVLVAVIGATYQTLSVTATWTNAREQTRAVIAALQVAPASDRFMAADPGAVNYLTGREGLVTPDDSLTAIGDMLRAYDVRWLILQRSDIVPALQPVLAGEVRPSWLSGAVAVVPAAPGALATAGPLPATAPAAAIYAVCFDASDTRCQ